MNGKTTFLIGIGFGFLVCFAEIQVKNQNGIKRSESAPDNRILRKT